MIGNRVHFLPIVDSTNNYVANLLSKGDLAHGTVILAETQTSGRGQRGNSWISSSGKQFTASFYLETAFLSVENSIALNMMVALSVQQCISSFVSDEVHIKWPNDILVNDKKIAGVLIETQIASGKVKSAICGIGINLIAESNELSSTNIADLSGVVQAPFVVLDALIPILTKNFLQLKALRFDEIKADYLAKLWRIHQLQEVIVLENSKLVGQIVDVSETGDLVFKIGDEEQTFGLKEIKFQY
jgi:BirA family biotin operon repressor/biotin-[acetyl-CoA-carboxylase] ligase